MIVSSKFRRGPRNGESGYMLLFLLLLVAVASIAFAYGILSDRKFAKTQYQRDREEEMIHRGVQYSRAIRSYYRKFNRYPAKIEDLENTNQIRFLRKRYKDPLTGKDFRLLHYGEAKLFGSTNGMIPGASMVGANGQLTQQGGFQNSSFGGSNSFGQNSTFGQNSNSAFGQNNQNNQNQTPADPSQAGADAQDANGASPNSTGPGNASGTTGSVGGAQFGGAPIVGVASLSKDRTIREFDKKRKYNEWQFIYDPTMDRGGLITTPYQPQLIGGQGIGQNVQNMNGQNGTSPNGNGFGNSFSNGNNGFGNSFGNSPGGMQNTPSPPPSQPTNPPQQQ
jgi:hypothetical protein